MFTLINRHGQSLESAWHPASAPLDDKHVILLGHGVTANMNRPFLKALAESLAAAGFHALRFSWSGNGGSGGDFRDSCISREVEDLRDVIDTVTAAGFSVSYAGHSMGGAVGVLSAASDARIRRLICLAPMVETARFVEAEFAGVTPDAGLMWDEPSCPLSGVFVEDLKGIGSTLGKAAGIKQPVLIVHGVEDDLVPVSEVRALEGAFRTTGGRVALLELPTDHVFSGEQTGAMTAAVAAWLAETPA